MNADATPPVQGPGFSFGPSGALLAELEQAYKDIHANPELSMEESRTAGIAAAWLQRHGYEVTTGVGGTGVIGLLRNGEGATVLLRADMDALPIRRDYRPRLRQPCHRHSTASDRPPALPMPAGMTCMLRG